VNNDLMNLITAEAARFSGNALIRWKTDSRRIHEAPGNRALLSRHLYLAEAFRKPKSYPRQRNYYGLYYFSQTRSHVWHESLNEANMMMFLDHTASISEIASQPMQMVFADGGRHVPDLMALHTNHRQVVYDIKPADRISSQALEQFAKTSAVCAAIGWDYQVLPGLPEQVQTNLTWLSYFKHTSFAPAPLTASALMAALDEPLLFDSAAAILRPDSVRNGRSSLLHLLWMRAVSIDVNQTINSTSLITRTNHANN
jgi:hypothetical protein